MTADRVKPWQIGLAALLVGAYWLLAVSAVRDKCTTADEIAHLTAGYSYWLFNDYRLNPENGNLPQRWGALPLLFTGPEFPSRDQLDWRCSQIWLLGSQFFYDSSNDVQAMLWSARAIMAFVGVAIAVLVFCWSRRLFGAPGALVSLAVCVGCPTLLAHGPLVTSDATAALFFLAAVGCLWRWLHHFSTLNLLLSAIVMGALFLSKFSAPLIVPIGLVLIVIRLADGRPLDVTLRKCRTATGRLQQAALFATAVLVHGVVVWAMIWAFYGFRASAFAEATPHDKLFIPWDFVLHTHPATAHADGPELKARMIRWARDYQVLPEAYLFGLAHTLHYAQGRAAFFNGAVSNTGWPSFFPCAYLMKTPSATLGLMLLAAGAAVASWRRDGDSASWRRRLWRRLYPTAPLWVLLIVYWLVAINSHLNIGLRHILPAYPPMFILAGSAGLWFSRKDRQSEGGLENPPSEPPAAKLREQCKLAHPLPALLVAGLLALLAVDVSLTWPNYLAYFNRLSGGPENGYKHLVDSSLDWGQDLPGLKKWLDRHAGEDRIHVAYFGWGRPAYYGINVEFLRSNPDLRPPSEDVPPPPQAGIYCISATVLQSVLLEKFPGPWSANYEAQYQNHLRFVMEYENTAGNPEARTRFLGNPKLQKMLQRIPLSSVLRDFDSLRLGRLCAWLRERGMEPDDQVGYSILIYRLSDRDLQQALYGLPPETTRWISSRIGGANDE